MGGRVTMRTCKCKCLCREETALTKETWHTPSDILVEGPDIDGCSAPVLAQVPNCIECHLGWHKKEATLEDLDDIVGVMCAENGGIVVDMHAINQRAADIQPRVFTGGLQWNPLT